MEIVEKIHNANTSEFLLKGEDHTLANILCTELRKIKGVMHSGYRMPHPLGGEVVIYVQTDGSLTPKQAVKMASENIVEELNVLMDLVNKNVG